MRSSRQRFVALVLVIGFVWPLLASPALQAQEKPFKVNGEGYLLEDLLLLPGSTVPHCAVGRGTAGLGRYFGIGAVQVDNPQTGEFSSAVPFQFRSFGNGDILAFHYGRTDEESGASPTAQAPGLVQVVPVGDPADGLFKTVWLAEFNPVPSACTGRFRDVVEGSFVMLAETEPFTFGVTEGGVLFIPQGTAYSWEGEGTVTFAKKK